MKLLLDTHAFIWFVEGNARLSLTTKAAIEDPANEPYLSMASLWEMAIKIGNGKLTLSKPFDAYIDSYMAPNAIAVLPIERPHISAVVTLPHHHRDPFDRLLVAQAAVEQMTLISVDSAFDHYGIQRLW